MPCFPPRPCAPGSLRDHVEHDSVQGHVAEGWITAVCVVLFRQQGLRYSRRLPVRMAGRFASARYERFLHVPCLWKSWDARYSQNTDCGRNERLCCEEYRRGRYRRLADGAARPEQGKGFQSVKFSAESGICVGCIASEHDLVYGN